ncbi:MAG: DedA family protein [Actinomycetota bacterium]
MEHLITHPVASHGYLAVFVLMAISCACIPIPSEIVLVFGGALATEAFASSQEVPRLSFLVVALVGVAGSVAGSWIAYWAGYAGGRPLVERWGRYVLIRPHEVDRAERWFERHGEAAVFWTRVIPLVRAFVSLPAGVARMPFWRFTLYTALGVIPWCLGLTAAGYALGTRWHTVESYVRPISIAIAALLLVALGWWIVRRARARPRLGE